MKIKTNFISNSSSSSFIVQVRQSYFEVVFSKTYKKNGGKTKRGKKKSVIQRRLISLAKEKQLLKYGFRFTDSRYPSSCEFRSCYNRHENLKPKTSDHVYLLYSITVNQDEVIQFLTKKKIPFIASIHYGHSTIIYDGYNNYVLEYPNHGLIIETYYQVYNNHKYIRLYQTKIKEMLAEKLVRKVPISEYNY